MNAKKIGRPQKPYTPSWPGAKPIPGLCHDKDGRWRIAATGQRFVEPDERIAIARFLQWEDRQGDSVVDMPVDATSKPADIVPIAELVDPASGEREEIDLTTAGLIAAEEKRTGKPALLNNVSVSVRYRVPKVLLMAWIRATLTDQAKLHALAADVGVPELSGLWSFVPKTPVKLQDLLDTYKQHADVTALTKRNTCATFTEFMKMTGATTLDDLTTDTLSKYRDAIKDRLESPGSIAGYFGRAKQVIRHGQAFGHDAKQISEALDRMAVLKAPKDRRTYTPTPISRENWDKVYKAAKGGKWQGLLLTMLNLCLHFGEALDLEWQDFDLEKGTFCARRNKTGRVIRAAVLWPETLAVLKAIPRTGSQFVFVSKHGTRFNASGQWAAWDRLRKAAGADGVQLDDIRDGAYSAAANSGVEERCSRLLAGHRSRGWEDAYVQRNPGVVAPACQAVYRAYMEPLEVKAAA